MSIYQVIWDPSVYSEVASAWLNAADRLKVMDAVHEIDQILICNPFAGGTELSEELFWVDCVPLRAIYSIDEAAKRVNVYRIRQI